MLEGVLERPRRPSKRKIGAGLEPVIADSDGRAETGDKIILRSELH